MSRTPRLSSPQGRASRSVSASTGTDLLQHMQNCPEEWQFAQAIRVLLHYSQQTPISLSLVSDPGYRYTSSEVTRVQCSGYSWTLSVTLPSLSGIRGVLPYGYQDRAHQLRVSEDDSGLQDFYEIFNQRLLLSSYRVATRNRLTCRFEEDSRDLRLQRRGYSQTDLTIAERVCALAGVPRPRYLPADHIARYVGLLGQKTSSPSVLQQMLRDYFELPVMVTVSPVRRHRMGDECRTSLSSWRTETNTLGNGAVLGCHTWMPGTRLEVIFQIDSRERKQQLEQDQRMAQQVGEFCNLFLGHRVDIDLRLQCHSALLPRPQLSVNQSRAVLLGPHHSLQSGSKPGDQVMMTLSGTAKEISHIKSSTGSRDTGD